MQINQSVKAIGSGLVGVVTAEDQGRITVSFQVNANAVGDTHTQEQDGGEWVEYVGVFAPEELKAL